MDSGSMPTPGGGGGGDYQRWTAIFGVLAPILGGIGAAAPWLVRKVAAWWQYSDARRDKTMTELEEILDRERKDFEADRAAWSLKEQSLQTGLEHSRRQQHRWAIQYTELLSTYKDATRTIEDLRSGGHPLLYSLDRTDGVILAGSDGTIVWVNDKAGWMFGWPDGGLRGRKVEEIVPDRFLAAHRAGWARVIAGRSLPRAERVSSVHGKRRDGSEFAVDIALIAFDVACPGCGHVLVLSRAQIRQRFDPAEVSDGAIPIVGGGPSASGVGPSPGPAPVIVVNPPEAPVPAAVVPPAVVSAPAGGGPP